MAVSRREKVSSLAHIGDEFYDFHAMLCEALADPKRLQIINALRDGSRLAGELTEELGFTQSNASQHLAILRDRGVLRATRQGNTVSYSLRDSRVLEAVDLLRAVTASWPLGIRS